ncbi:MAG: MarR family winged helix-turn-helix transcriptional regulator [Acidimicrobiales bacterium]
MKTVPVADAALASSLRISVSRLARRLRAQRTDDSLSATQLAALATLDRHGPMTPGELADHEKVQPPSMTRVIAALEDRGLTSRTPHPRDGRQALVAISPAGSDRLRADRRRREAWLSCRLAELDPEDVQTLRAAAPVLERLSQT